MAGVVVGAAQGVLLAGRRAAITWAAVVGAAWALGWLVTLHVIVDAERGYVTFGASGALLVTVVTWIALYRVDVVAPEHAVSLVATGPAPSRPPR